MNKTVVIELIVLVVLLVVAFCLGNALMEKDSTPAMSAEPEILPQQTQTTESTQNTTEPTQETTESVQEAMPDITWMTFPEDRQITAKQYFVYDVDAKEFVTISGAPEDTIYPASVTKLFTCYVALQFLDAEQVITVGEELSKVVAGSSVASLRQGDQLKVSDLVAAMLLPSGNDAAYVLAANVGKTMEPDGDLDTRVSAFMKEMNRQAKEVGMTGANFANPDGIHRENHYMTFSDLAVLGTLSVNNPTILECAGISRMEVAFVEEGAAVGDDTRENGVKWKNTNAIIDPESEYYCPYATGLKTGQTPYAGSCLLSSFACGGKTYVVGVFGCPDTEARFQDTLQLFNQTIA